MYLSKVERFIVRTEHPLIKIFYWIDITLVNEMFKKFLIRLRGFLNQPVEKQLMVLILIVFLIFLLTLTQYVSVLTEILLSK